MNTLNRRDFVRGAGLTGVALMAGGLAANRAVADPDPAPGAPPPARSPEPELFSFALGGTEAFVIHDFSLSLPSIQPMFVPEATKPEIDAICKREFLSADHLSLSVNILVLKTNSGVMLFDTGIGHAFGPVPGRLLAGLEKLGIKPGDVKFVFITHAHLDHVSGLLNESGQPVFPSAKIVAAREEVSFWTGEKPDLSGMRTPAEATAQALSGAQKVLGALKDKLDLAVPGRVAPGVELVAAPGHTPGHSLFQISQGDEVLVNIGDAVHLYALQFARPDWTMSFDVDPAKAVKTRVELFKKWASQRTTILAAHLPFPGIGHVRAAAQGYEWVPRPWVV
jgi:glyoxylase-like metal-dependent hydrolase (beta-lactamase superfamily II)